MTDNLERPAQQEILEWQKDEFLGDLWNEIKGNNPYWLYIKQVKNPEKAKKQLKEVEEEIKFEELKEKEVSEDVFEEFVGNDEIEDDEEYEISDEVIDMESMLFEKANVAITKTKSKKKRGDSDE